MNPFVLPLANIMQYWKELRNDLKNHDEYVQIQNVVDFWSSASLKRFAHDPEALDDYETPWEMMHQNDWCENSVAVGMEFTLRLGGWSPDRLRILYIRDPHQSIQRLVVELDGKYWINYEYGTISEIPQTEYYVMDAWRFTGRGYTKE